MKIIQHGKIPTEWPYEEWECDHCHCIFMPEEKDGVKIEPIEDYHNGDAQRLARIDCPQCGRMQVSYGHY